MAPRRTTAGSPTGCPWAASSRLTAILFATLLSLHELGCARHPTPRAAPDGAPTLYAVAYAHLDTQWRWEYPQTIRDFLPDTLRRNFALFEKYPDYVFNFTGANRYQMIQEYYPREFEQLRHWVAAGRWFPAGSSMEECDVNSPSPESILRQVLYGNEFFRREFHEASTEFMLPDCFGFPATLPSLLAHAGLEGFSTQKLTWQSGAPVGGPGSPEETPPGIPFNVGFWAGPDGRGVIAALDPGSYGSAIFTDLSKSGPTPRGTEEELREWPVADWPARLALDARASGIPMDYRYYGTGDQGGAPSEFSVHLLEQIITGGKAVLPSLPATLDGDETMHVDPHAPPVRVGDGPVRVVSATADRMFRDITATGKVGQLPRYQGDLELKNHSAGSLTSQAIHKRWNRQNEILAGAAEAASVAAAWLGRRTYPQVRLNAAWRLVMGGQFHDILAGTATPKAYDYSWNDDVLAMNQFAEVLTSAAEGVAAGLDTRAEGTAVVIYNPLGVAREDVVEASIAFPSVPRAVQVVGPDGRDVPAQLEAVGAGQARVVFLARAPSLGFAVYDVRPAARPATGSALHVTAGSLENARYRVRLDAAGDVASILDKTIGRDLLAGPARLALLTEQPRDWPAWNMDWSDQRKPPRGYVQGPATVRVLERGPARIAVAIDRTTEGSRFVQTVRLSAGDAGNRVEFQDAIDWRTPAAALKATFPLSAGNADATYDWGAGLVRRGNDEAARFEVGSHRWFDLTDRSGAWGTTVLSDCKTGSDKPDDHTLRLTLLYTPGLGTGLAPFYPDQASQDWGHHELAYGLAGHSGGWRHSGTDWQAYRLNVPLVAFVASKQPGPLGKSFSMLRVTSDHVRVMALKKAEESDEVVVRIVEMEGEPARDVRLVFAAPVLSAREVDGQERPLGQADTDGGALVTTLGAFQIRTFAVKLGGRPSELAPPRGEPLALPYDLAASSADGAVPRGGFSASGEALPSELLPARIDYRGVDFRLASGGAGSPDAVIARGQTLRLPAGRFNRVYVLAASASGDRKAVFRVGAENLERTIQDWGGYLGQWDHRLWKDVDLPVPPEPLPDQSPLAARQWARVREYEKLHGPIRVPGFAGLVPGYIKRSPVAWFASHRHTAEGRNEPYAYAYLFAQEIELPPGATTLTLPDDDRIRILAATAVADPAFVVPARPLYDEIGEAPPTPGTPAGPGSGMSEP